MCCCGPGYWMVALAEEKVRQSQITSSCQGFALASTSLPAATQSGPKKLVDPNAKPWDDDRVWGGVKAFLAWIALFAT